MSCIFSWFSSLEPKDWLGFLFSFIAIIVAYASYKTTRATVIISIKQSLMQQSISKAKDCNDLWIETYSNLKRFFPNDWTYKQVHNYSQQQLAPQLKDALNKIFDVVSELTISKEILKKGFELFKESIFYIPYSPDIEKDKYSYIFWKQLNTSLSDYFITTAIPFALIEAEKIKKINDARGDNPKIESPFACQIHDIYFFVNSALEQEVNKAIIERLHILVSEIRLRPEGS